MRNGLSVLVITKNASSLLHKSLKSVKSIANEIIIVDEYSSDQTIDIASKFTKYVYSHSTSNQGMQKNYALSKARYKWILILDSDEILTNNLRQEIEKTIALSNAKHGYYIPYINHFLNQPLRYGGEGYSKLILFQKRYGYIVNEPVHDKVIVDEDQIGHLKNYMNHYSYQNAVQVLKKFNAYAKREAAFKYSLGERSSLVKIVFYPMHMFYSRFMKDKGYKDGILIRLILDSLHAFLEFQTYLYLSFIHK